MRGPEVLLRPSGHRDVGGEGEQACRSPGYICFCCLVSSLAPLFGNMLIVLVKVEEIVMNELEILATEVIQEAQVDSIALVLS